MGNSFALTPWDYLTFIAYFLLLSFVGYWFGRKKDEDSADYFLAGRSLPWYVVGASYIAANISTEHFIGMIGAAVIYGICVATPEWSSIIAFSFLIWIFIPFLLSAKVFTAPEFLEKRFNSQMRFFFGLITVIANIVAFLAPVIYGGGLILERVMGINQLLGVDPAAVLDGTATDTGLYLGIAVIGVAAGVWAIWGGLKSVAWMDLLTIVIMIFGGLSVTFFGLAYLGEGAGILEGTRVMLERNQANSGLFLEAMDNIRAGIVGADTETYNRLSVIQPLTHETTPWTHWIMSFFYIGLWYTVINQFMIQRVLGAKDQYHAQMGVTFAGFLKLLIPFVVVIPGLIWFAIHPEMLIGQSLENIRPEADKTYVNLISLLVPVGLRGILLAALFGAIQSTVSAVLTSTSTILTMDFYKRYYKPGASEDEVVGTGRIITAVVLVLSILLGIWISTLGQSLFVYIQELFTFFAPPFSAVFLLGTFWKRVNGTAAFTTSVAGLIFGFLVKVWVNSGGAPEWLGPYANQGLLNWAFCMVLVTVISLLTAPPPPEKVTDDLTFNLKKLQFLPKDGRPWYQGVAFWWTLSVILMFALIFVFGVLF
ncbi:sodium/solute symporter [Neolewinella lacunae]|uniref:Sodium/solute symporter n=1 Tax=Neolewinella lacunae TaxID=1517758 RepID=A0A923T905_9BACT|nr:sodium/solute symporter [Neolewinella lacunae]MBC6995079.1 sodium/solute symporter [Neolewinella lacunae]MDN3635372.1 sodium/solute symporter [Neolewinella lacunae]